MNEHYFQFPVSALRLGLKGQSGEDRWSHVLMHACLEYGRKAINKTPKEVVEHAVAAYRSSTPAAKVAKTSEAQRALAFGFSRLNVNGSGDYQEKVDLAYAVARDCMADPYPTVRIRTDIWWDTFQENKLSYREFAVICAVYAAVGAKPFAKVSAMMIQRYAAGYTRQKDFDVAVRERIPGSLFLTDKQLRTTLIALETLGFFAKFTFNRGECFFSHRMDRKELTGAVTARKLRKIEVTGEHRVEDQKASEAILERRKRALSGAAALIRG